MCGRYVATKDADGLVRFFMIDDRDPQARSDRVEWDGTPNYNVAPTDSVPSVVRHDGQLVLTSLRWGLVPFWAKDPKVGARMINARAETIAEKSAFAQSFEQRRCLIPADGFYEWEKAQGKRLPWFVHRTDGDPLVMAGIWSSWRDKADPTNGLVTCSIITTRANAVLEPIHERMPVVLDRSVWDTWLDPHADAGDLRELLGPAPAEDLQRYRVSTRANSVANNDPSLVEPLDQADPDDIARPQDLGGTTGNRRTKPADSAGGQGSLFDC